MHCIQVNLFFSFGNLEIFHSFINFFIYITDYFRLPCFFFYFGICQILHATDFSNFFLSLLFQNCFIVHLLFARPSNLQAWRSDTHTYKNPLYIHVHIRIDDKHNRIPKYSCHRDEKETLKDCELALPEDEEQLTLVYIYNTHSLIQKAWNRFHRVSIELQKGSKNRQLLIITAILLISTLYFQDILTIRNSYT